MSLINKKDVVNENITKKSQMVQIESNKNSTITALLCIFLGIFGIHSFYVGRNKSGTIKLMFVVLFVSFSLMYNITTLIIASLILLVILSLTFLDYDRIIKGRYLDAEKKVLKPSFKVISIMEWIKVPFFCFETFIAGILFVFLLSLGDPAIETSKQTTKTTVAKVSVPVSERSYESLQSCVETEIACSAELNKRLENAVQHIDSIYAEGNVREADKLSSVFYGILKSDGSGIPFANYAPTAKGIAKRIENLLPSKGCFADSIQYANYFSTIYEVETQFEIGNGEFNFSKYLSYLNRGCKLKHYDVNVIITEERFVDLALKNKIITKAKANSLYNEIFKHLAEDDFVPMTLINQGKAYKGYGTVEMKKNRTVSYVEAPSKDMNDATALMVSAFNLFSFGTYMPFKLHPSVQNVEIGFNISELEFNLYAGYYHGIYAVTIKTDKITLDKYYEKNGINPPRKASSDIAISERDKEFLSNPLTYRDIKKWCARNGFTCSKYLVDRTR